MRSETCGWWQFMFDAGTQCRILPHDRTEAESVSALQQAIQQAETRCSQRRV